MTDRAERFIKEHVSEYGYSGVLMAWLPDLLEQFHSQCLPTDEEIRHYFRKNSLQEYIGSEHCDLKAAGAIWCRNFVRDEKKEVIDKPSTTEPTLEEEINALPKKKMVRGNIVSKERLDGKYDIWFEPDEMGTFEIEER